MKHAITFMVLGLFTVTVLAGLVGLLVSAHPAQVMLAESEIMPGVSALTGVTLGFYLADRGHDD